MARLNHERAAARDRARPSRDHGVIGPAVRPARSGKRYDTAVQAERAVRYVNTYGQQRALQEWFVMATDEGEAFELWRRPRRGAGR